MTCETNETYCGKKVYDNGGGLGYDCAGASGTFRSHSKIKSLSPDCPRGESCVANHTEILGTGTMCCCTKEFCNGAIGFHISAVVILFAIVVAVFYV